MPLKSISKSQRVYIKITGVELKTLFSSKCHWNKFFHMHHYAFNKWKQIDVTVQRIFGKRILFLYLYFGKYTKNHSLGEFLMAKKNGNNISAVHPFVSKHIFLNFYRGTS